jgi:hypothetical protein
MHIRRLTVVLFLILGIVFTTSPLIQGEADRAWVNARPGVIQLMDSVYAVVRNFIAGIGSHNGIDDHAPSADFEIITTNESGIFL